MLVSPVVYGPAHSLALPTAAAVDRACGGRAGGGSGRGAVDGHAAEADDDEGERGAPAALREFMDAAVSDWKRRAAGVRTVAFCHSIVASRTLTAAFLGRGLTAVHIDGTTSDDARERAFRGLRDGTTLVTTQRFEPPQSLLDVPLRRPGPSMIRPCSHEHQSFYHPHQPTRWTLSPTGALQRRRVL